MMKQVLSVNHQIIYERSMDATHWQLRIELILIDDVHIGAAQALLKMQFSDIGGLRNTLLQYHDSAESPNNSQILQIIYVKLTNTDHWIVMSTISCMENEVELHDSLQLLPIVETQIVIAKYLRSQIIFN